MPSSKKSPSARRQRTDAIALLKADHRQVEEWFSQFEKAAQSRKQQLARQICDALTVHTTIEEEIFYPAFLAATEDKQLIAQIQRMSAGDDYFDAKVTVLSEMIKHHVKEEEQPGGMFAEAKKSDMDLQALGEELMARKKELQAQSKAA